MGWASGAFVGGWILAASKRRSMAGQELTKLLCSECTKIVGVGSTSGPLGSSQHLRLYAVASPGLGAKRNTCKSYWIFTGGNCRDIVAVRHCTGQSALKKINCCKSTGHVPQCPIAGDASDYRDIPLSILLHDFGVLIAWSHRPPGESGKGDRGCSCTHCLGRLWFLNGGVNHFERKFQGKGSSTNGFWCQKTRVSGLSRGVVYVILYVWPF